MPAKIRKATVFVDAVWPRAMFTAIAVMALCLAGPVTAQMLPIPVRAIGGAAVGDSVGRGAHNAISGLQDLRVATARFNERFQIAEDEYFRLKTSTSGCCPTAKGSLRRSVSFSPCCCCGTTTI